MIIVAAAHEWELNFKLINWNFTASIIIKSQDSNYLKN